MSNATIIGTRIQDAGRVNPQDELLIPVSDGSGLAVAVRLGDIISAITTNYSSAITAAVREEERNRKAADKERDVVGMKAEESEDGKEVSLDLLNENGLSIAGVKLPNVQAAELITQDEFKAIEKKKFQYYFVARNERDKEKVICYRIYLANQLMGQFSVSSAVSKFPVKFPFKFA